MNNDTKEILELSRRDFIKLNLEYIKSERDGKLFNVKSPMDCPLAQWVQYNDKKCSLQMVANTADCPLCGKPICPDCMNHNVEQLSRVTGYLSGVSGWNEAKKEEFAERKRYEISR